MQPTNLNNLKYRKSTQISAHTSINIKEKRKKERKKEKEKEKVNCSQGYLTTNRRTILRGTGKQRLIITGEREKEQ